MHFGALENLSPRNNVYNQLVKKLARALKSFGQPAAVYAWVTKDRRLNRSEPKTGIKT